MRSQVDWSCALVVDGHPQVAPESAFHTGVRRDGSGERCLWSSGSIGGWTENLDPGLLRPASGIYYPYPVDVVNRKSGPDCETSLSHSRAALCMPAFHNVTTSSECNPTSLRRCDLVNETASGLARYMYLHVHIFLAPLNRQDDLTTSDSPKPQPATIL